MPHLVHRRFAFILVIAIAAGLSACSGSVESPVGPSAVEGPSSPALTAGQFSGSWTLTSLQVSGEPAQPAPPNATYRLTFADDRVSARADCNTCGGAFRVSGSSVTIGPALACTRAACPTMQFETLFETILSGDSTASLDGDTLVLASPRGRLTLAR
jgi:heat shock protein HslJ